MSEFTIDIDLWTSVEAKDSDEAYAIGQWLIDQLVAYAENLDLPIQAQVKENGVEAWETEEEDA